MSKFNQIDRKKKELENKMENYTSALKESNVFR